MTNEQIFSMNQYYTNRYGTPSNDNDAIEKLIQIYKDLFHETPSTEVQEGIGEYYRIISGRDLPAYSWLLESLHVTSKKDKGKRNFPYAVGMLRTWLKYGFGHIPNQEEDELIEYFTEVTGYECSLKARRVLQTLMGKYGLIKVTKMINELKNDGDMSLIMMLKLSSIMDDKYKANNEIPQKPSNTVSA